MKKEDESKVIARDREEARQIQIENIESSGASVAENGRERFQCISIIGQIEGHYVLPEGQKATKYEQIIPLLVSIEESEEVDGLLMILNMNIDDYTLTVPDGFTAISGELEVWGHAALENGQLTIPAYGIVLMR